VSCGGRAIRSGHCRGSRLVAVLVAAALLPGSGCAVLDLPKDEPKPLPTVVVRCEELNRSPRPDVTPRSELERSCASLSPTPTPTPTPT